ncbi:MAG: hypothetical protein GX927_13535 [Lentisphaerae bacterium]|nr:hypothetical protein [Lentisphaerota bacterium]
MPASRRRSISPPTEKVKPALTHKNFGQGLCRALTGLCRWCDPCPRALPWAGISRPFRADPNITDSADLASV